LLLAATGGYKAFRMAKQAVIRAKAKSKRQHPWARRIGLASRSAWGYRIFTRLDYPGVLGMQSISPSLVWIHDVHGDAPITLGTLLEDNKSMILATDFALDKSLAARVAYRTYLAKGSNADRFSDRDFLAFSLTKKF